MRARGIAVGSVVALLVALPGPAHAAKWVQHGHYSFEEPAAFEECGLPIEELASGGGTFMVREVRGSKGQAYLAKDNYWYKTVWTNADTKEWMLFRGRGMFKEMTGTHVAGNIWEFTAMDVGQPVVIEDSDGHVVLRDRGRLTFRALFDTLGDGQPGGVLIEDEITGVSGPHPSLEADFCEIVTDLIG